MTEPIALKNTAPQERGAEVRRETVERTLNADFGDEIVLEIPFDYKRDAIGSE